MKMDVSKFKKVRSDDKKTVLKHPRGHEIIIAHNALDKTNLNQLKALPELYNLHGPGADLGDKMAEGGDVGPQSGSVFRQNRAAIQRNMIAPEKHRGDIGADDSDGLTGDEAEALERGESIQGGVPVSDEPINVSNVRSYAEGTPDAPVKKFTAIQPVSGAGADKYKAQIAQYPQPVEQSDSSSYGNIGGQSPLATPVTEDEAGTLATSGFPIGKAASYPTPSGMSDLDVGFRTQLGGLQKQQEGAAKQAQATAGLGEQEATTYGTGINQLNNINNAYMKHYEDISKDRQALMQEYNSGAQHLDPQRYVKSMSTGDKVMTGIALVLGGIGSGMTHGPNLAADFLQKNIDRDIENQRMQLGIKQNLLGFNFQQSKDLQDATNVTKLNSLDMVGMYLKRQAAQAQNPLQQAALLNQAGIIDQKAGEIQNQIAMRRAFMQIGAGGAGSEEKFQQQNNMLRMMGEQGEKMAKSREEHHVPGMAGQSSVPVSEGNRGEYQEMQSLSKSFQDAQNYLSSVGAVGAPLPGAKKSEGIALKNRIELSIGKLESLNRFTHEEAQRYKEMIPDLAGTHITGSDQAKLNTLQQELENKMGSFKEGLGYRADTKTPAESAPRAATGNEVERITKDGKIAIFDGKSKKFLRYK